MNILIHLILSAIAVAVAAYIVPGVSVAGFLDAVVVAIVLALINIFIRPILSILTLPINVLTLGLFSLVISAVLVMFVGVLVPGFVVTGFLPALVFAIVLSLITIVFGTLA